MKLTYKMARQIARKFNLPADTVWAVVQTESSGESSWGDGKIPILVERHKVYKYYKALYGWRKARAMYKRHPDICNPKSGGYGKYSQQYKRLAKAIKYCGKEVAHKSTSFGMFQLMGFNHEACGFNSAVAMADELHKGSEEDQLRAQVTAWFNFISNDKRGVSLAALQARDWHKFAYNYNGSGYMRNNYASKLATASQAYRVSAYGNRIA